MLLGFHVSSCRGNAIWCRETLFWRFTELAQDALEKLDHGRIASAMLLTRAAVETAAALWYLDIKITRALESSDLVELDEKLKQLVVGYKDPSAYADGLPKAINVLTFVGQVDKEIAGYSGQYAALCEYSHTRTMTGPQASTRIPMKTLA
jgi:hypothetical protein